ncbi:conserved hypothetical protein [Plasmopara halstedii]|uniref:Nudix hydrolase domain-containing protein n=1 Tax=Plasmopara halstedii TaxID=4781 RepID=A0A0N7L7R5_PLAHL|nr:conserved hypothetical protein [Plasmopara halstedii]CEG47811.1 conserved hypothetical protein [Plasmopara halstedii]|eukprot:XP_024584180.1 conserved hypothetical protein [Plasmopara halstedii]
MTKNSGHTSGISLGHDSHNSTSTCKDLPDDRRMVLSTRLLKSRVGRERQRYDDLTRLLVCIVVSRRKIDASYEILLISSFKHQTQWIIPKGGWENDETVIESALREANEEAGVTGEIVASLGTLNFYSHRGKPCRFFGFQLEVTQVFEHWAESTRQRKWVTFEEACELLESRPELVEMVVRAANKI